MSSRSRKLNAAQIANKFREKNNREPRNANELAQFSKKLRGTQPLSMQDAKKYFLRSKRDNAERSSNEATEQKEESKEIEEPAFEVGDEVVLTKDRTGIVRFVGTVEFAQGLWYGIELHPQFVGSSDGEKDGTRYFECDAQRGIFAQKKSIRRKMNRNDHARKESWMVRNAERNSRIATAGTSEPEMSLTPEPPIEEEKGGDTEATEEKDDSAEQPEELSADQATEEDAPAESEANEEADAEPVDDAAEDDADAAAEQDDGNQEEKADEENKEDDADDGDAPAEPEAAGDDDEPPAEEQPSGEEQEVATEQQEVVRMSVQIEDFDFYPAKDGDNLLQFLANQADLALRGELLDLYMNDNTNARLEMVFQALKPFDPLVQRNLFIVDLLPRLKTYA